MNAKHIGLQISVMLFWGVCVLPSRACCT